MSEVKTGTTGAVLVVGAGVAGMQSSLDLADSGYLVHLVDRSPAIGGLMSQLDKTFPTNDCAMCIISPKLVEVGRHPNIRIHPNSQVEALEGAAGRFEATLTRQPRFIDLERCTACGQCRQVCPASAVNEFNQEIDRREATFMRYPQAIPRGVRDRPGKLSRLRPLRKGLPGGSRSLRRPAPPHLARSRSGNPGPRQ